MLGETISLSKSWLGLDMSTYDNCPDAMGLTACGNSCKESDGINYWAVGAHEITCGLHIGDYFEPIFSSVISNMNFARVTSEGGLCQ